MHGLRGEKPKNLEEVGLKEFYLHHNKLGEQFIKSLAKVLKYDQYLRVLDLKFNKISENTIKKELMPSLRNNQSLTNIDLRKNPGFTLKVKQ